MARDKISVLTAKAMRHRLTRYFHASEPEDTLPVPPTGSPENLVLFEVPIAGRQRYPGFAGLEDRRSRQRIDAVAVGMWSKKGNLVRGVEIKVSRADLLAELRDPSKAEAGVRLCDQWWLALGDAKLLKDTDEIPAGWGVLVPRGSGLSVLRPAATGQGEYDSNFIAGLLYAGMNTSTFRRSMGWWSGYARGKADATRIAPDPSRFAAAADVFTVPSARQPGSTGQDPVERTSTSPVTSEVATVATPPLPSVPKDPFPLPFD